MKGELQSRRSTSAHSPLEELTLLDGSVERVEVGEESSDGEKLVGGVAVRSNRQQAASFL